MTRVVRFAFDDGTHADVPLDRYLRQIERSRRELALVRATVAAERAPQRDGAEATNIRRSAESSKLSAQIAAAWKDARKRGVTASAFAGAVAPRLGVTARTVRRHLGALGLHKKTDTR